MDSEVVTEWKPKLGSLTENYELNNTANCNETGLYYTVLPNKTLNLSFVLLIFNWSSD